MCKELDIVLRFYKSFACTMRILELIKEEQYHFALEVITKKISVTRIKTALKRKGITPRIVVAKVKRFNRLIHHFGYEKALTYI